MAQYCADFIIERGGKRLMEEIKTSGKQTNVYSTKLLTEAQRQLFNEKVVAESSDFIKISLNRIKPQTVRKPIKNVVITSKNAVEALLQNFSPAELQFQNIYCVGRRTKKLIEKKIGSVVKAARNSKELADYLVEYISGTTVTYFCSDIRLDALPKILEENHIEVTEVHAYKTMLDAEKLQESVEGILFYSPSTVQSYISVNKAKGIAFCIGETTAKEASNYFEDVRVAKVPTVESVIELVNSHYAR